MILTEYYVLHNTYLMFKHRNRIIQKGVLKRFTSKCYGKQSTLESIRAEKAFKFKELKNKKCTKEYSKYFLRYFPGEENYCDKLKKNKTIKIIKTKKNKKNKTIKIITFKYSKIFRILKRMVNLYLHV